MIEFGEIKEVKTTSVVVFFPQLETEIECQLLYPYTTEQQSYFVPAKGEQVACLLSEGKNICLGSLYNDTDKPTASQGTLYKSNDVTIEKTKDGLTMKKGNTSVVLTDVVTVKKGLTEFIIDDKISIKGASTDLKTVLDSLIDEFKSLATTMGGTLLPPAIIKLELIKKQLSTLLK
ncbi:MAG: hypothetical protein JXA53_06595 [Bacteroidales bacterium]|nr:hypothetical protein [Bacteroidales bacterium]